MTLNITILTPATIYQSADFRLTDNGKLVTNRSAKSVIEHHTIPKAINNYSQIIGSAVADHGQHAVIWQG